MLNERVKRVFNLTVCHTCGDIHSDWTACPYARWQLPAEVVCDLTAGHLWALAGIAMALGLLVGVPIGAWWCP